MSFAAGSQTPHRLAAFHPAFHVWLNVIPCGAIPALNTAHDSMIKTDKPVPEDNKPINLKAFIPYRLTRLSENFGKVTSPRYKKYQVTSPEWRVLAILTEFGTASSKFIQEHTNLSRSRVNRTLDSMVKKQWITRELESHDRRQNRINLTELGQSAFAEAGKAAKDTQDEWLESFSDAEIAQLYQLLDRLEQNMPR